MSASFDALEGAVEYKQCKPADYWRMKEEWRSYVDVQNSAIQGLGVFAKRNMTMDFIILEYVGEVIRNEVANRREKESIAKGKACYFFKLARELVIDATSSGNAARFVNHSCDPNCKADVIKIDGIPRLVISTSRPIWKGEELTIEYKFSEAEKKVPCLCGAPNCRQWM